MLAVASRLLAAAPCGAAEPKPFLPASVKERLSSVGAIHAECLKKMRTSPLVMPGENGWELKPLSERQRELVLRTIRSAREIDIEMRRQSCRYDPGLLLVFSKEGVPGAGERLFSALLCLNCDVWASGGTDLSSVPSAVATFGDAAGERKALEKLYGELCPEPAEPEDPFRRTQ